MKLTILLTLVCVSAAVAAEPTSTPSAASDAKTFEPPQL